MTALRACLIGALFVIFLQILAIDGHAGHAHAHHERDHVHGRAGHHHPEYDHDHQLEEVPHAFRYSRQANQPPVAAPAQPHAAHGLTGHSHNPAGRGYGVHSHAGHAPSQGKLPTPGKVAETNPAIQHPWFYALLSTLLISLAPFFILYFIPIDASDGKNQPLLRIFLSFASGSLLGDAFLHLIPHAVPHSHGHERDHGLSQGHSPGLVEGEAEEVHDHMAHTIVGLWVLAGIVGFLIIEKVIRHVKGGHDHGHGHGGHSQRHNCHSNTTPVPAAKKSAKKSDDLETTEEHVARRSSSDESGIAVEKSDDDEDFEIIRLQKRGTSEQKSERKTKVTPVRAVSEEQHDHHAEISAPSGEIRVSGYLNLAADFAHNFTDGLAIGASFLAGQGIGWITALSILFHEIPHEIGDFALLIQSGCSKPKAILLQLVTTFGAFAGCLVSLTFGASSDTDGSASPVLALSAGGFIYIATVSVIPEILTDAKVSQSIKEILALLTGIALMGIIAIYE